jgi:hypothetical protein
MLQVERLAGPLAADHDVYDLDTLWNIADQIALLDEDDDATWPCWLRSPHRALLILQLGRHRPVQVRGPTARGALLAPDNLDQIAGDGVERRAGRVQIESRATRDSGRGEAPLWAPIQDGHDGFDGRLLRACQIYSFQE